MQMTQRMRRRREIYVRRTCDFAERVHVKRKRMKYMRVRMKTSARLRTSVRMRMISMRMCVESVHIVHGAYLWRRNLHSISIY